MKYKVFVERQTKALEVATVEIDAESREDAASKLYDLNFKTGLEGLLKLDPGTVEYTDDLRITDIVP